MIVQEPDSMIIANCRRAGAIFVPDSIFVPDAILD